MDIMVFLNVSIIVSIAMQIHQENKTLSYPLKCLLIESGIILKIFNN
ncbi:MAG: hypothetical protein BAJALOKI3v1_30127 [Promethearchaeota archaeon]|nr:MAG: hypothetical protein BAJALOKI3v1_30127 [Candidatus Lokiarchaeota archaeon]